MKEFKRLLKAEVPPVKIGNTNKAGKGVKEQIMNKEQQIKEMADEIFNAGVGLDGSDFAYKSNHFDRLAIKLYNAGYRKQGETVKEFAWKILADISQAIDHNTNVMENSRDNLSTYTNALITNNACKGIYDVIIRISAEYGKEKELQGETK